ncbi:MAG: MBL fold metallo-hydrolase [Porticoccaceae bacterium]|nr:MBL fold metallo-hydrolase [Porticoccaceae bacterium]|tara:strand:- start:38225 stop:38878 length:654 start_codon:yes stop_codon:yes gene_type:complete
MTKEKNFESSFIIRSFPVGPFQCNCSIIGDSTTKKALVIDPGGDPELILATLIELQLSVVAIIHTHAHLDHILAAGDLKRATGASIYLHRNDKFLWDMLEQQCLMMAVAYKPIPEPDYFLSDDDDLSCCGGIAIHTPGHSPGSMSFWFEQHQTLIAGDTLFKGSIGRTDLPGGDISMITKSIKERIYSLDDSALVITGHGPSTRIGIEKNYNNFVRI